MFIPNHMHWWYSSISIGLRRITNLSCNRLMALIMMIMDLGIFQTAYKNWICSLEHRFFNDSSQEQASCISASLCSCVEKSCPFFRVHNETKLYGGQPCFLCQGKREEALRCKYDSGLCPRWRRHSGRWSARWFGPGISRVLEFPDLAKRLLDAGCFPAATFPVCSGLASELDIIEIITEMYSSIVPL